MKSLTESPAVLSVHEGTAGQYIIRVGNLRHRPLVVGITKLLAADARSFVVITPSDIKVFAVGNGDAPSTEPIAKTEVEVDAETQAAIDAEEGRTVPGTDVNADDGVGDGGPSVEEAVPAKPRRRAKPTPLAGHDEACARCAGRGRIQIALDNGAASETACPLCQGQGVMKRYGARR